jgi:hypothetical protein
MFSSTVFTLQRSQQSFSPKLLFLNLLANKGQSPISQEPIAIGSQKYHLSYSLLSVSI